MDNFLNKVNSGFNKTINTLSSGLMAGFKPIANGMDYLMSLPTGSPRLLADKKPQIQPQPQQQVQPQTQVQPQSQVQSQAQPQPPVNISINTSDQTQPVIPEPVNTKQTFATQTIPSPLSFQPSIPTEIPSSMLSSTNTYADVLAKRKQYEDQYARALQEASDVYTQGLRAVEEARYMGETSPFAQGQMERIQRNANLSSLAASNRAEQYGKLLGINQQNIQNILAQQPTSLGSQVNQATGDVFVTTRNPMTGQTQVINAGNIGAQKSFVSSSVNQDPFTGQLIFTGVRQDGTVETQNLSGGGQPMASGQVPFAIQSAINYAGNTPFIDSGNLTPQQLPMAQSYAAQSGVPLLSKEDATKLKEANATFSSADALLSTVEQYANKIVTATSPAGIPSQFLSTKLGSLLKTNPDAVLFDSSISAFSSLLTRAAGEKGVLTDQDVARIINGLPTRTDTVQSATKKVEALRSIYEATKNGVFDSYIGAKKPQTQTTGQNIIQTKIGAVDNSWFD